MVRLAPGFRRIGFSLGRRLVLVLSLLALGTLPVAAAPAISQVAGDVYVPAGGTVPSLRLLGGSATVNGTVAGNAQVVGGTLRVNGLIRGAVQVTGGHLLVGPQGRILGPVQLFGTPLSLAPGAYLPQAPSYAGATVNAYLLRPSRFLMALGQWLGSLLLGLLLLALFPRALLAEANEVAHHPGRVLAVGLAALIGGGLLTILLAITLVGIPFALGLVILLGVAGVFGLSAVQLTPGREILGLMGRRAIHPFWSIALGSLLIQFLGLIPGIGWAMGLLILVLAVGASLYSSFGTGWRPHLGPVKTSAGGEAN